MVSPIGFGAVKIGRNLGLKHGPPHRLPDEAEAVRLLNAVVDMGINLIDTAPAYGLSEERVGLALRARRAEVVLSTKVGETFENGVSRHDFSPGAVASSLERSLRRLGTEAVDLVLIHSNGDDLGIMRGTGCVEALIELRRRGLTRLIGLSGKTVEGAREALAWADAIMVPLSPADPSHAQVCAMAGEAGVGVLVKKALDSGRLADTGPMAGPNRAAGAGRVEALRYAARAAGVSGVVVGSLDAGHMRDNLRALGPDVGLGIT